MVQPTSARLQEFTDLLIRENERQNLTGARSALELWHTHITDSLAVLPLLQTHNPRQLLDLGTGGGLPGIPLACLCDELDVTLLDATRKKIQAVQRIIAALGLRNARAVWGRAEVLAHDPAYREQFDAVTSRAVAELPALLEYAAGFLRLGGHAWFFKSAAALGAEQAAAVTAATTCGMSLLEPLSYRLPGESTDRVIVCYQKANPLPLNLPRRPGRAQKRPL